MRNLYNGRTDKPCSRVIYFDDVKALARFVNLYKDLFYKPVARDNPRSDTGFYVSDFDGSLYITAFKDDWKKIVEGAGLKKVHKNKEKFWRYEAV